MRASTLPVAFCLLPFAFCLLPFVAAAQEWHTIHLNYTVLKGPAGSPPGASSSTWELWLGGKLVSRAADQPLWHRGIASMSTLGKAVVGSDGLPGSFFGGAVAAFDIAPAAS